MPLHLRGLKAWVSCEGERLPEFQRQVENDRVASCYIPSTSGKKFVVKYGSEGHVGDILAQLFVDGRQASQKLRPSTDLNNTQTFQGAKINDGAAIRPFVFAAVRTTCLNQDPLFEHDLSQLGTIEVKLYRVKITNGLVPYERRYQPSISEIKSVPETAKVIGFNRTRLAEPKARKTTGKGYHYLYVDSEDEPYVIFRFRHLPHDILQARGILSVDQKPSPANKKGKKRADPLVEDVGGDMKRKRTSGTSLQLPVPTQVEEGVGGDNNSSQNPISCDRSKVQMLEQALKASQDALEKLHSQIQDLKSAQSGPSSAFKVERPSPIRLGPHDGEVIDLTED